MAGEWAIVYMFVISVRNYISYTVYIYIYRKSIIDFITGTSDTTFVFTKENANTKAYVSMHIHQICSHFNSIVYAHMLMQRFTVKGKGVAPYKPSSSSSSGGDISGPIGIAIIGL